MNAAAGTLLLSRSDVRSLLRFEECIDVVENAFRQYAEGKALKPALMHVDSVDGEFHVKAGGLELSRRYFALKSNGGFFQNMARFGKVLKTFNDPGLRHTAQVLLVSDPSSGVGAILQVTKA